MNNFRKIKKNSLRILQRSSKSFVKIYKWLNTIRYKLLDLQLNRLKSSVKNQTGVTLRTNVKMFEGNNLPHELLLT